MATPRPDPAPAPLHPARRAPGASPQPALAARAVAIEAQVAARRRRRALVAGAALAVAPPLLAAGAVLGPWLAGADSGQWVMLARAYDGQPYPAYRDPFAVPPAAPLLALAMLKASGDPFLAPKLAVLAAFALVPLAAFLLGRELFGWLPGVVAGLLVGVGQHFYLRLALFGALPQLLAVAAFGGALAAIARNARSPGPGPAVAIGVGGLLLVASHAPTAAVGLPVLALTALLVPPHPLRGPVGRAARGALGRVAPLVPAGALFAAYAWAKRGAFDSYLSNEAAFHTKGLGVAAMELLRLRVTSILLVAGGAVLLLLLWRAWRGSRAAPAAPRRRGLADWHGPEALARAAAVLGVPAVALGLLMLALYGARVGTDYPRIFPLAGFPAIVAVASLVPPLGRGPRGAPLPGRQARAALLAGALVLPVAAGVVQAEARAAPFYSVREPGDLRDVLAAVEARVPVGDTVWTPVREGKWTEGITGRAALFGLPAWAIFRPWEWERKVAADLLGQGSAWMTSGLVTATFARDSAVSADNPAVRVYYKGDLKPLLRVDDGASTVRLGGWGAYRLADLPARQERTWWEGDSVHVGQRASPTAAGGPTVSVERHGEVREGSPVIRLDFTVRSQGAPIEDVAIALAPAGVGPWMAVEPLDGGARIVSTRQAEPLAATLRVAGGDASIEVADLGDRGPAAVLRLAPRDGPDGARSEARGTVLVVAAPVGEPPPDLDLVTAERALERHGVRWALLPSAGHDAWRASAQALGFRPVHENPTYTLLQRGGGP